MSDYDQEDEPYLHTPILMIRTVPGLLQCQSMLKTLLDSLVSDASDCYSDTIASFIFNQFPPITANPTPTIISMTNAYLKISLWTII